MAVRSLHYRITKLIEREVYEYLQCENQWEPRVETTHLGEHVKMTFEFPADSEIPAIDITVAERSNAYSG